MGSWRLGDVAKELSWKRMGDGERGGFEHWKRCCRGKFVVVYI